MKYCYFRACYTTKSTRALHVRSAIAAAASLVAMSAHALSIDSDNPDLKIRFDNSVKYSAGWRVNNPSSELTSNVNLDDGNRNFEKGLISNRLDLYSEFDVTYKNFGLRLSGAAWRDGVYLQGNDNTSPSTANSFSAPYNNFTSDTKKVHGQDAELLDAFIFGRGDIGSMPASFRLGRHGLLWGESLYFGSNGIAGGQAPIDAVKALSVPGTTFKELIKPVGQVSGQLQIKPNIAVGGYYQYEWEKSVIPASGSYFSNADQLDSGGERLFVGPPLIPNGSPSAMFRGKDIKAKDSGQFGLQLRYRPDEIETDFGIYAIQFHAKTPQTYIKPSVAITGSGPIVLDPANFNPLVGKVGELMLVYPERIRAFGASFSTSVGDYNIAGEISTRRNTPLVSGIQAILPGVVADNDNNPLYPVGNTLHAQVSWLATLGNSFIAKEASLIGEVAWNRVASVTKNPRALDPNGTRDAWGVRLNYAPTYRQAFAGVDLTVPIGISYFPKGKSLAIGSFGVDKGGDISVGVDAVYLNDVRFSVRYTHYYGPRENFVDSSNRFTYGQSFSDRDFISASIQKTF